MIFPIVTTIAIVTVGVCTKSVNRWLEQVKNGFFEYNY